MKDILDSELGSKMQSAVVVDIQQEQSVDKDGVVLPKLYVFARLENMVTLRLDDAWVMDRNRGLVAHGLWLKYDVNGQIFALSTIGKLMAHHNARRLRDLIGKVVWVYPKHNDFMALIATQEFDENNIGERTLRC